MRLPIFASINDTGKQIDGIGIVIGICIKAKISPHEIGCSHELFAIFLLRGVLISWKRAQLLFVAYLKINMFIYVNILW